MSEPERKSWPDDTQTFILDSGAKVVMERFGKVAEVSVFNEAGDMIIHGDVVKLEPRPASD